MVSGHASPFSDTDGVLSAVQGMRSLEELYINLAHSTSIPASILPALQAALHEYRCFTLFVQPPDDASARAQLESVFEQWDQIARSVKGVRRGTVDMLPTREAPDDDF